MAAKYMGAKLLQKKLEKQKKKDAAAESRTKGSLFKNENESLDSKSKRRFDITAASMMMEGDFELKDDKDDKNPEFTNAYDNLRRNPYFLLTYEQQLFQEDPMAESESDEEADEVQQMLQRANTETQTLFKGNSVASEVHSVTNNTLMSMPDVDVNDSLMDNASARGLLKDNVGSEVMDKKQLEFERDVKKLKNRIESNLELQQDVIRPRRFIIKSSDSQFLNYFEYLVMTLAIWNAVWTPLTIGFDHAAVLGEGMPFAGIDLFVDTCFWIDIFVGFLSSYVDSVSGDEVYAPKQIAVNYIFNGSFFIDFMSTFPFSEIGVIAGIHYQSGYYLFANIMSLLKAFRLKKILKKIRDMPIAIEEKALMQVMYYAFLIFIYTHIIGCIMWLSLKKDDHWVPAVDFGAVDTKTHLDYRFNGDGDLIELDENYVLMYKWFTAWYNSAISFALVEVNARSPSQVTLMFGIYVINAMINAYLIGIFIDQFQQKNAKKQEKQDELDDSNQTMTNLGIVPVALQNKVRIFFLQSFQMKMLQQEFIEIMNGLKDSLQERMKFEIAERIITDSRIIFKFRVFMVQHFAQQRQNLQDNNPNSPSIANFTNLKMGLEYKAIIFALLNNLKMAHHIPGDKVIRQNDEILDEQGNYFDSDQERFHVFFIMTGNYSVQTLMFDMKKKLEYMANLKADKSPGKNLKQGDIFGEVSVIFGCRRTATVKAKQYCECAYIKNEEFLQLLSNHNILKQFFIRNMMDEYTDELRIFLVGCLRKIDYLKDIQEDILNHLALHMIVENTDKGKIIHYEKNAVHRQVSTEVKILYKGKISLTLNVDNNTDLTIDTVGKGTILDAHNFLVQRFHRLNVKCVTSCMFYYLPYNKLTLVAQIYPSLAVALKEAQQKVKTYDMLDLNMADYIEPNFDFKAKYPGMTVTEEELKKVPNLRLLLKNAVMHGITTLRKNNERTNSLKTVLKKATMRYNDMKTFLADIDKKRNQMVLTEKLDTLVADKNRIKGDKFYKIKKVAGSFSKDAILESQSMMNQLKEAIDQLLPIFETGENDAELEIATERAGMSARASYR